MNRPKVFELEIKLLETLTPKACSKLVIHLIKYILYQAEQIPLDYESFARYFRQCKSQFESRKNEHSSTSYKEMRAQMLYKTMESLVTCCENTFKNLESEFVESNGIEEIVIIVGATKVIPKKVFRIIIPSLSDTKCDHVKADSRNLQSLCRHVITSDELHDYFKDKTNPTNIFIFLKMHQDSKPKTQWFVPNGDFRLPIISKQMTIYLQQPCLEEICIPDKGSNEVQELNHLCENSCNCNDMEKLHLGESIEWYQSKECLKGLKGEHWGTSIFSLLSAK